MVGMSLPSPRRLFFAVATAEAVTWTLLLIGMFLKYVTETTELGVRIGGMLHGVVFIVYVLVGLVVWVDRRWTAGTGLLVLATAVPPLATLWTERWLDRRGQLAEEWRLHTEREAPSLPERVVGGALRRPGLAAVGLVCAVAALTAVALVAGPPASTS